MGLKFALHRHRAWSNGAILPRGLKNPSIEEARGYKRVNKFGKLGVFTKERPEATETWHQPDLSKNSVQLESFMKSASTLDALEIGTFRFRLEAFQVAIASCKRFLLIASFICARPEKMGTLTRQQCIRMPFDRNARKTSVPNLSGLRALIKRFRPSSSMCAFRIGLASDATPIAACA